MKLFAVLFVIAFVQAYVLDLKPGPKNIIILGDLNENEYYNQSLFIGNMSWNHWQI